jgi:hypothetical protein
LRLDDGQFWLRAFQARASAFGIVAAFVVDSALRRCDAISCALQIGDCVPARLWPRAYLPRSILQLSGEYNGLDLVPSRHRASDYLNQCPDVFGVFFVARLAAGAIT